jgi:hypothetical protein
VSAWEDMERALAVELPMLGELDTILWEAAGRCVQLQQTRLSLGLAVVSNEYLAAQHALTPQEEQQLAQWGWEPPDPGDLNWHIEIPWPMTSAQGAQAAKLLRQTMQLVLRADDPADITVSRFTAYGATRDDAAPLRMPRVMGV